jgi:hypothetical protein
MAKKVVIIVPTQGASCGAFEGTAYLLKKKVYPQATIVKAEVGRTVNDFRVSFKAVKGQTLEPFSWASVSDLSVVLIISHGAACDGPNLAYGLGKPEIGDPVRGGSFQPWGVDHSGLALDDKLCPNSPHLTAAAKKFWEMVGRAMEPKGYIILVGCDMGAVHYGQLVAYAELVREAAKRPVYASEEHFGAGRKERALQYIKKIEAGKVPRPMKKFAVPAS